MPPISTHRRQWNRFKRRNRNAGPRFLATRPRMMTRRQRFKRSNQVSTKVFYFKINGTLVSDGNGNIYRAWTGRNLNTGSPGIPVPQGWTALKELYDQYKVLALHLRLYPANVGIEPDATLLAAGGLLRGNAVVWTDQRFDSTANAPTQINQVISNASTHMLPTRGFYRRSLFRARGYPTWANTQGPATVDSWNGSIELLVNNATPASLVPPIATPLLWYYTLTYKVIVRGRTQN